jgi:SNF2 family DNA or RNA helicase
MLDKNDMRGYQKRGARFMKKNKHSGLFLDMGLGKTVITLTALSELLDDMDIKRVLIVGPLRVVQGVWMQEAKKWRHLRHLQFKLLHGHERYRMSALQSKAQIHLLNVENLHWLLHMLTHFGRRKGFVWPYDTLVIDESSMFKTPSSKRFTALRFHLKKFKRRHILTGTPAPNGLEDVWAQAFICDLGARLGRKAGSYRERFFSPSGFRGYNREADDGAKEKIANLLSDMVMTMRAEDYLELPPELPPNNIWVDLPPKVRALYERMETEMFLELDEGVADATHAATVTAKCWQIANGFIYLEDGGGDKVWKQLHDAKIDALKEVLEGTGDNMLVAYYHKPDLERLRKAFPKALVLADTKGRHEQEKLQDKWNTGKHRMMFVHPQGAGHGLNFAQGAHTITFFSLLYGHEWYRQVIERIGRARQAQLGSGKIVQVNHILARSTVDEAMLMSQRRKHDNERGFVNALHEYRAIKRMLG